ncbi:hypothetical protein NSQ62_10600 [Solibacillus sp. FSL H8-0523]|uniref:hypothetical protein n=1 Tax=Solibacillus sp. FSL H8-0523 TaxID=2954511 RepID=UPI0031018DB8
MGISMMEAYGIELLKSNGIPYEQVSQQFSENKIDLLIEENFDFAVLKTLFDTDGKAFEQAYAGNYTVKFLTINGLRNLLRMRFGIQVDVYETLEAGNGLSGVPATAETEQQLRLLVSSNWKVDRHGNTLTLYV